MSPSCVSEGITGFARKVREWLQGKEYRRSQTMNASSEKNGLKPSTGDAQNPSAAASTTDAASSGAAASEAPAEELQTQVVEALRTCFDPEIPVNICDLGLVYSIQVDPPGLTSPMCPVAGSLPPEVEAKVRSLPGVTEARVEVVWDPPWSPSMMSEAAKLQLNVF